MRVGRTSWKLHRDVVDCTSGRIHYYVGTYQMLRRDVISSTSSVKIAKKRLKTPSIEPGKSFFVQCFLIFSPKIPLKHLYFADFMAIYGRLWQFLKKNNYNTADRKTLILFNIPSVAKTKRVRHCLITHPSYYNLVYSLAGNSLLILRSILYFSSK